MGELRNRTADAGEFLRGKWDAGAEPAALIRFGPWFTAAGLLDEVFFDLPLHELPGMPAEAPSQSGRLVYGRCGEKMLLLQEGHYYLYDGFGVDACVLPLCGAVRSGVRRIVCVDWCGSVRNDLKPGTWTVLTDYINGTGISPLMGNLELTDDPFLDMNHAFSQELNAEFINAAAPEKLSPRLVICYTHCGPQLLTPAEIAMVQKNGADVVAFGIASEAMAMHALGAQMMSAVLVTHAAAQYRGRRITRAGIMEECRYNSAVMVRSIRNWLSGVPAETAAHKITSPTDEINLCET